MKRILGMGVLMAGALQAAELVTPVVMMDTTDISSGWREPGVNVTVEGNPLTVAGKVYASGLGVHAPSRANFALEKNCARITGLAAVDDESFGTVEFKIWGDEKLLWQSGKVSRRDKVRTKPFDVDVSQVENVCLEVTDWDGNRDGDHADWLDLNFHMREGYFGANDPRQTRQLGILTPPPAVAPRINGPAVLGVRPGHPVLFRIPVTGEKPLAVTIGKLPQGLVYDSSAHILSGAVAAAGDYPLAITAANAKGTATRTLTLKVGDRIGLTPAMGWNSWNCFGSGVSAEKVKAAADALIATGLADHGWNYVNIDDFWQNKPGSTDPTLMGPARTAEGMIVSNARFPDMKGLADYVHAKGLKIGLYSSPGPLTCGGCTGSWQHEAQDARTYATWGYDFLKYDWCSYGKVAVGRDLNRAMYPYLVMGKALREQNRDILFSLCQYGGDNVSYWGALAYGQSWRTTGDMFDSWPKIAAAIRLQRSLWYFTEPGAFNDPDMLCVGRMVWNHMQGSRLTPNEQYTHISLWALVASPLMIGCDLTKLDDFTRNLLVNDEVIAIDQDTLGKGAACIVTGKTNEIWARPLADGSLAVGLFNRVQKEGEVVLDFARVGLTGTWRVRDCWRQCDESPATGRYAVSVPGHATHLVRLIPTPGATAPRDIREYGWIQGIEEVRPLR